MEGHCDGATRQGKANRVSCVLVMYPAHTDNVLSTCNAPHSSIKHYKSSVFSNTHTQLPTTFHLKTFALSVPFFSPAKLESTAALPTLLFPKSVHISLQLHNPCSNIQSGQLHFYSTSLAFTSYSQLDIFDANSVHRNTEAHEHQQSRDRNKYESIFQWWR